MPLSSLFHVTSLPSGHEQEQDIARDRSCPRGCRIRRRRVCLGRRWRRRRRESDRAGRAAVAHLGGGTANEVERGDEEGAWEVEVTKANGETVDVHLDTSYKFLSVEDDSEDESGDAD